MKKISEIRIFKQPTFTDIVQKESYELARKIIKNSGVRENFQEIKTIIYNPNAWEKRGV